MYDIVAGVPGELRDNWRREGELGEFVVSIFLAAKVVGSPGDELPTLTM